MEYHRVRSSSDRKIAESVVRGYLESEALREIGSRLVQRLFPLFIALSLTLAVWATVQHYRTVEVVDIRGAALYGASALAAYVLVEVALTLITNKILAGKANDQVEIFLSTLSAHNVPQEPFNEAPAIFHPGETKSESFRKYLVEVLDGDQSTRTIPTEAREALGAMISVSRGFEGVSPRAAAFYLGSLEAALAERGRAEST